VRAMGIRDWFRKAPAEKTGDSPEPEQPVTPPVEPTAAPAVVEAPALPPLPVATAPTEAKERIHWALGCRTTDPVMAGERLLQVSQETGLTVYQLSRLDDTLSEPGLQNLAFLAKLPHEIHIMVRQGVLLASKAQMIGRYLAQAPADLQIRAAQSVIKHNPSVNRVQTLGRIWQKSGEFQFKD
jgi:hypothetical protein